MGRFFEWINHTSKEPPLIKAGMAHLWFVTLHPFDDGNRRIARAIGDLLLERAEGSPQRFYSLSGQIERERKAYYEILERVQTGSINITEWLFWILELLHRSVDQAQSTIDSVLRKTRFWNRLVPMALNERQMKILDRMLEGFEGNLSTSQWAAMAKCSPDTALRDINDLIARGVLKKSGGGGRSTRYNLKDLE